MNFYNLLFGNDNFYCIFCKKHHPISDIVFSHKGIGVCKNCDCALKTYSIGPMPIQIDICNTIISILPYTAMVKRAINDWKFNNNPGYTYVFAYYINSYVEKLNATTAIPFTEYFSFVTAVPLSLKRFRKRGYNQAELLAVEFAKHFDLQTDFSVIKKIKETKPQSKLSRIERSLNMLNAFESDSEKAQGKDILLIDDIFTTGNTITSCAKALKNAGANNISVLTLANKITYMHTPEYYKYIN